MIHQELHIPTITRTWLAAVALGLSLLLGTATASLLQHACPPPQASNK